MSTKYQCTGAVQPWLPVLAQREVVGNSPHAQGTATYAPQVLEAEQIAF